MTDSSVTIPFPVSDITRIMIDGQWRSVTDVACTADGGLFRWRQKTMEVICLASAIQAYARPLPLIDPESEAETESSRHKTESSTPDGKAQADGVSE